MECIHSPHVKNSRRSDSENSNSGWLYADMLLGLLFVFLASSSINSSEAVVPAPRVKSITSTSDNGEYGLGSEIDILVQFDQPVVAIGDVKLQVETNNGVKFAQLMTSTPNEVLKFIFTVESGDQSQDLDYSSRESLVIEQSGALNSIGGNVAVRTLPEPGSEGSLGFNKDIVINFEKIDGSEPECTSNINRNPISFLITWNKDDGAGNLRRMIEEKLGPANKDKNIGVLLVYGGVGGQTISEAKADAQDLVDALLGYWASMENAYYKTLHNTGQPKGNLLLNVFLERSCD